MCQVFRLRFSQVETGARSFKSHSQFESRPTRVTGSFCISKFGINVYMHEDEDNVSQRLIIRAKTDSHS